MNCIFLDSVESFSNLGAHLQSVTNFGNVICETMMKNKENPSSVSLCFFKYLK